MEFMTLHLCIELNPHRPALPLNLHVNPWLCSTRNYTVNPHCLNATTFIVSNAFAPRKLSYILSNS